MLVRLERPPKRDLAIHKRRLGVSEAEIRQRAELGDALLLLFLMDAEGDLDDDDDDDMILWLVACASRARFWRGEREWCSAQKTSPAQRPSPANIWRGARQCCSAHQQRPHTTCLAPRQKPAGLACCAVPHCRTLR